MRQCLKRRLCLRPLQRWTSRQNGGVYIRSSCLVPGSLSTYAGNKTNETPAVALKLDTSSWRNRLRREQKSDVASWVSLLENALPLHLRKDAEGHSGPELNARHVAEIILAARHSGSASSKNLDVLFHLGIEQGRWRAAVWLVKQLLDKFAPTFKENVRISDPPGTWKSGRALSKLTANPISPRELTARTPEGDVLLDFHSLNAVTDDLKAVKLSQEYLLCQGILGSIWQTLGSMTIVCADRDIQPEILEIIAYLHHMEIMPASIYNQKPSSDPMAVQQPLMLSLFSSRILTSLSDAAWKAHQKLVVEAAKARGSMYVPLGPELPGTAYRINVASLRPEVWLELILWSCLHRGWIAEGTAILLAMFNEPKSREWKPLSWRSLFNYAERDQDWDTLEYMFNTQPRSAREEVSSPARTSVRRTISSEVVNAYVDALLNTVRPSDGEGGKAPLHVIERLNFLQKFLQRSGMNLETASWDAIILRFFEYHENVLYQKGNFDLLMGLSPSMGEELESNNKRPLPAYIFDGSAAVLGLFHRAMRSAINKGDVRSALRLFESLQSLADKNKHRSVVDFFRKQQMSARGENVSDDSSEMFTDHVSGIEYPAFDVQIPPTILGPFLELVLDAKAHDFAGWLLYSDEIDGPVIPEHLYEDPAIAPVLVRFAAETNDTTLLSKLIELQRRDSKGTFPKHILQSFFEVQVRRKRWDAAENILKEIKLAKYYHWNSISVAYVIRAILLQIRDAANGDEEAVQDLDRAKAILSAMVRGKYERRGDRSARTQEEISLLLAALSTVDRSLAEFCLSLQPLGGFYWFQIPTKDFNIVLEGVVDAYGSNSGQRLLDIFWSRTVRGAQRLDNRRHEEGTRKPLTFRYVTGILNEPGRRRTVVDIPGYPSEEVVFYNGLRPDFMTVLIVLRKAIEELKQRKGIVGQDVEGQPSAFAPSSQSTLAKPANVDIPTYETIVWAVECLRSLDMTDGDIKDELNKALPESELQQIKDELLELVEATAPEDSSRVSTGHDEDADGELTAELETK